MPTNLRKELSDALLFAFSYLGPALESQQAWLVLGSSELSFAKKNRDGKWEIVRHARSKIRLVKENPGLSLNRVTILGDDNDVPLLVIRYTNRQKKAMSHILFILDQDLKHREPIGVDPGAAPHGEHGTLSVEGDDSLTSGMRGLRCMTSSGFALEVPIRFMPIQFWKHSMNLKRLRSVESLRLFGDC